MKGRYVWSWSIMMCNCAFYFVQAKDYTCNLEVFIVMASHLYGLSMCVKARDENSKYQHMHNAFTIFVPHSSLITHVGVCKFGPGAIPTGRRPQ